MTTLVVSSDDTAATIIALSSFQSACLRWRKSCDAREVKRTPSLYSHVALVGLTAVWCTSRTGNAYFALGVSLRPTVPPPTARNRISSGFELCLRACIRI
jgi:hypothetical protein